MKTIRVFVSLGGGKVGSREVEAYETKSPYLFVHHSIVKEGVDDTWTITHMPTGWAILACLKRRNDAIKAINEYWAEIPGWENVTPDSSTDFFAQHRAQLLRGREVAQGGKGD